MGKNILYLNPVKQLNQSNYDAGVPLNIICYDDLFLYRLVLVIKNQLEFIIATNRLREKQYVVSVVIKR